MPVPTSAKASMGRRTLRNDAYDTLKANILNGTLAPGERLDDRELQAWLGVSRTPIREALVILDSEGLVDTQAQRPTRVAAPDPALAHDEVKAIGALMSGVLRQTIASLSGAGAKDILGKITGVRAAAVSQDAERASSSIQELHESILRQCPNGSLAGIVERDLTLLTFQLRATLSDVAFEWDELRATADALQSAVESRDAMAAVQVIEAMHFISRPA